MAGRLLLVGELSDDLSELRIEFEALGLTVDVAPDGLAGLEQGREFQPDLVVTEILTNRLSGFELASRIRGGEAGFEAPVIFYTEFYRDEKARRDVIAKYGAMQYFVRPFQKEALRKLVAAYFQEFFSSLPAMPTAASPPEPVANDPEVSTVVPQLSRAASAAEKQPASLPSRRSVQADEVSGSSGEVPGHAFDLEAQAPPSEAAEMEPGVSAPVTPQAENQPIPVPVMAPLHAESVPMSPKVSRPSERSLLLPVEEPSLIARLVQSIPVRIAAVVIVAVLAVYFVRDWVQSDNQETLAPSQTSVSTQPSPTTQITVEPNAQQASPIATVPSSTPTTQDPPVAAVAKSETELAKPPLSSSADLSTKEDSVKKAETADSGTPARGSSPALSIQDVTGSGRGPVLRKMKPVQLSQDVLNSLAAKPVVVRVVIDNAGKVTEVVPLNQEGAAVPLPPDALATIEQWKFSRSRRKDAGEAVKYFCLKVQNPR